MRLVPLLVAVAGCGDNLTGTSDARLPDGASPIDAPPPAVVLAGSWGGIGTAPGQFVEPSSVELDSEGFVYVAGHEDRVQKFTRDGELVAIWGTTGAGNGQFSHPHGLAIDRTRGDLIYVGDQENRRVQVFTRELAFVRLWTDDQFRHLHDVGIDPSTGDIYVGDYELGVLQRFTADGTLVAEVAGAGAGPGQFSGVWGISTDSAGNVYVADTFNRRLQKLDATGAFVADWRGETTPAGAFMKPTGVFVDARDRVYLCDSLAQAVYVFDVDGGLLEHWDLATILGTRSEPEDIVIDANGDHIYIAEVAQHRVYHLVPAGR